MKVRNERFIRTDVTVTSQKELFEMMAELLYDEQLVKEDYLQALMKREEAYPTGLQIHGVGFAIPHTDVAYVKQSGICFVSLKHPVMFKSMEDPSKEIPVRYVFMLAMHQAHDQLTALQNLMRLFQDCVSVQKLGECEQAEDVLAVLARAGLA